MKQLKVYVVCLMLGLIITGCKGKLSKEEKDPDLIAEYVDALDYENAITALNEMIETDTKNVDAYIMLAEVYEKSGRLDEAKEILEEALEIEDLPVEKEDEINKKIKNLKFFVVISETQGNHDEPLAIQLSNSKGYEIYYTIETRNSRLTTYETKYTEPILLDEDGNYIVEAYTVDSSKKAHGKVRVKYSIKLAKEYMKKNSWVHFGNIYRYRGEDGKIVTGWKEINDSWYYFSYNGNMATGILDIDGAKYCFNEGGVMLTGWQKINEQWYYFGNDGIIKTGIQEIDDKKYYFDDNGVMLTGWKKIDEKWYYITDNKGLSTGWEEIDGKWYYFADNGEMKTNQYIDMYYVGEDGALTAETTEPKTEGTDNNDVNKIYKDALMKLYTTHELGTIKDDGFGCDYELIDVNGDGIDELIVSLGAMTVHTDVEIFTAKGGQLKSIFNDHILMMQGLSNYAILTEGATHGTTPYSYYEYDKKENIYKLVKQGYTGDDNGTYDDSEDQAFINEISTSNTFTWEYIANEGIEVTPENIAALK